MAQTRRLAAILAVDVVGYSRLMGEDETGTAKAVREHREAATPVVREFGGRLVKTTGDGVLLEFPSVVAAVECAIAIQKQMVERNAGVHEGKRILYRIGVNLGDVLIEGKDILGDGVNIAARLESIAEPGGICISGSAYDHVRGRVEADFTDLGNKKLKNIAEPVRAYSVEVGKPASSKPIKADRRKLVPITAAIVALIVIGGVADFYFNRGPKSVTPGAPQPTTALKPVGPVKEATSEPPKAPERLSIVVLPFANLSGDPAQDYLADVITEELTSSLSRIASSFVIARSTAFTYKGKPIDVRQLGRDLGVRYALEGSAQRSDNRVRVTAQLIDADSGAHLWSDGFDADIANLLEMQDEIVKRLSVPLEIRLIDVDAARIARTPPANLDAQDLALQCMAGLMRSAMFGEEASRAYGFCERAVQIDEHNAIALTFLSLKYSLPVINMQSTDPQAAIRQAEQFAARALVADRNFYWAHLASAVVLISRKRQDEAIVELEQTLALNPGFTTAYTFLCEANNYQGRPDRGMEYADKAIRLSPRDPLLGWFYSEKAWSLLMMQEDDLAIEWLRRTLKIAPDIPIQHALLASTLALAGRQAEASEAFKQYLSLKGTTSKTIAEFRPRHRALSDNPKWLAYSDRLVEGLRKAGMPEQ